MNDGPIRIGVDLGGTKIEAIALDRAGAILARRRVATPAHDYDAIIRAVATLVLDIETETGQRGLVGVGAPGSISTHTGLAKGSNTQCVNGKPLDVDLSRALDRPVRVENDANCFALSEAIDGAGQGARVVFGVIIGTGVGGGVVVDGKIIAGRNHIGGEWGHTPLPWMQPDEYPGAHCFCGHDGCIETFLSGPGLARDYERRAGASATGQEIVARAERGEAAALAALDVYQDRLARALAMVIDILDPDVIALGGGVSNIARIYDGLTARVAGHAFTDALDTKILRNVHGDSGGVRGAAWLWREA
ncbi:ROK family protein [Methylocystis iwaonis]|uniref:Fructokinase n=1 Tax=Methylocystis iwaonis TaxID=2885079 RepID=A0ABN6VF36_9HYPH|nr:ROK family protein [Methylocystis iwaonis]BDV33691.1 fructokinase [Methylocystis iwaonis]